ncbi:uncharacterized protein LOC128710077 [Anopheles marshallii]|uniref:uncharacterized protein LOC128710077 n=1 Tax=Anopheles marshallii TaxID=1521116 RepID=UPI00237C2C3A|nr:uncharacterized protein LOC128710077 [Anopheles marshallii]
MDFQFKYACSCKSQNKLTVSILHDTNYQLRMKDRLNTIVDQSWDEADPEILSKLMFVPDNISILGNQTNPSACRETNPILHSCEKDLAIMKCISKHIPSGSTCPCEVISSRLSTILDAGLGEINIEPVPEQSLLEKLQLLKPFVQAFKEDVSLTNFLIRLWKLAIRFYCPSLIKSLAQIYPQFLSALVDELMKIQDAGYDTLHSLNEFKFLSRCLTISESFYATLSYLTNQSRARAQPLISACIRATKDQLSSKEYFALFPMRIRPYAIVMNEVINPNDPDLEMLIVQLKTEHPRDYRMLIMISPVFCCLDEALPTMDNEHTERNVN